MSCTLAIPAACRWLTGSAESAWRQAQQHGPAGYPGILISLGILLVALRAASWKQPAPHVSYYPIRRRRDDDPQSL